MKAKKNLYKKKIQTIVDILGDIVNLKDIEREQLIKMVEKIYNERNIEPFRGKAYPPDIFDKELASLYVVGKYGLGLDDDYPELFRKIFDKEIRFDEAIEHLMNGEYEEARKILSELSPQKEIDSNTLARMFRIAFTKIILGFDDENRFFELLKRAKEAFPEEERTVRNYVRYYIAFRTAEAIAKGNIRDKLAKEIFKQALSARLGIEKILPSDDYIREICVNVFKVPREILEKILTSKKEKE
ncbi:DUF2192 domain-containing protein [Desulfurococcaceae archaeon MEX13E-LK6-19]|nr:DUF2192 domain-containing protein [Desulfurococcaceae archaeon MEX13E-LK6-19]